MKRGPGLVEADEGDGAQVSAPMSSLVAQGSISVTSIELKREGARQAVALIIVSSILVLVTGSFVTLWISGSNSGTDLKGVLDALVAPIAGIVGAVTGFYFGASSSRGSDSR